MGLRRRPLWRSDLLPFTISDMDFATAPCITDALHQRINHPACWAAAASGKNDEFLAAVAALVFPALCAD